MFVALYIVCDECFVPSLDVLSNKLGLSPDVAGATFMAAAGSAPEFFTSLVGALSPTPSDVGIAAIVGSAVFNVLFVIGACGVASTGPLQLTWYPLARDSFFYTVDLLVIIWAFADGKIVMLEAAILFGLYVAYCIFMKFSERVEKWVKSKTNPEEAALRSNFDRLDQNHDGVLSRAEARNDAEMNAQFDAIDINKDGALSYNEVKWHIVSRRNRLRQKTMKAEKDAASRSETEPIIQEDVTETGCCLGCGTKTKKLGDDSMIQPLEPLPETKEEQEGEDNEPMSACPPKDAGPLGYLWYVLTLPLVLVLMLTVPDVRRKGCWGSLYVPGFLLSIVWIAAFSKFMVDFTEVVGRFTGIPTTILALTLLAWGTSVPDLLTSVLVTLQGHGDMAVSSSIGSNIFDVTVGLPVPWMIYLAIHGGSFPVGSSGLFGSIIMLIGMLAFTVGSIMCNRWTLNTTLGVMMLVLFAGFTAYSIYAAL